MKKSSGVIVKCKNQVLLCKRVDNGKWSLPMGGIELGETAKYAAYREFYEETNLEITDNISYIGKIIRRKQGKIINILFIYLLEVDRKINPNLKHASDGFEHSVCGYFSFDKIKNLNADNSIKQIISKVFLDF